MPPGQVLPPGQFTGQMPPPVPPGHPIPGHQGPPMGYGMGPPDHVSMGMPLPQGMMQVR